jgi:3-deoxy-D-manno-octulosonate 8-phosphate phosphatase (KDO 8-P phosphatase)
MVSSLNGGQGVFREVGDIVLIAKGLLDGIIEKLVNHNHE